MYEAIKTNSTTEMIPAVNTINNCPISWNRNVYNTTAFLYEATAAFEQPETTCNEIETVFEKYIAQLPGLLGNLGSGTGLMSILFTRKGWHVYGVELSSAMIAVAEENKRALPADIQTRLNWTSGNITDFNLPDGLRLDGPICLCTPSTALWSSNWWKRLYSPFTGRFAPIAF